MNKISVMLFVWLLSACNNHAPDPKKAKGDWYELNTTIQAIKAETK